MQPAVETERTRGPGSVPFSFSERLWGPFRLGEAGSELVRIDVRIGAGDLGRLLRDWRHAATLTGTISVPSLGGTFDIHDGRFELFSIDPPSGMRQVTYAFRFTAADGQAYFFQGRKEIDHQRWRFDLPRGMTRLFACIHRGADERAPLYGAGTLRFYLRDTPALLASMQAEGGFFRRLAARVAFLSMAWGVLRNEYFRGIRLFYETRYENLVLSGRLQGARFLLVSGIHDRGFPWGDGELFSDVLLAVADGRGGYERYSAGGRVLPGLELDVAAGKFSYRGAVYGLDPAVEFQADMQLDFEPRACGVGSFPFPRLLGNVLSPLIAWLARALPGTNPPGIHITPHTVAVRRGSLRISGGEVVREWAIDAAAAFGECERGTFRSIKRPILRYHYCCEIDADCRSACVHVAAGTLRDQSRAAAFLSRLIRRAGSADLYMRDGMLRAAPATTPRRHATVLEVNHPEFPTAVFQRRIAEIGESDGGRRLALEEDMSTMRLEPIGCDRTAVVASIRNENKFRALDEMLEAAAFDALLEEKLRQSGKPRGAFSIAIKPNFMFAYDRRDRSTYTDPELVAHLAARLRSRGFERLRVVEAQCTYGEYFDKRSVREMAEYLGFDERAGYEVVDMTLDADEHRQLGPALGWHPVSRAWREADFRISFAKNKTHAYAYYSLTIKNIYGALPLANKFREYHCGRGIYRTAIEYLAAFPVDFGIIDAHLSADGPFGVFAAPRPNRTTTILGGPDLVAVDWVGAAKMGLDPMISRHMQLAVAAFGKPAIRLIGDAGPYRPWRNVPAFLTVLTHGGMDSHYRVGRFLYTISAQMDETHFHHKDREWYVRFFRALTVPVRHTLFLHTRAPSGWERTR